MCADRFVARPRARSRPRLAPAAVPRVLINASRVRLPAGALRTWDAELLGPADAVCASLEACFEASTDAGARSPIAGRVAADTVMHTPIAPRRVAPCRWEWPESAAARGRGGGVGGVRGGAPYAFLCDVCDAEIAPPRYARAQCAECYDFHACLGCCAAGGGAVAHAAARGPKHVMLATAAAPEDAAGEPPGALRLVSLGGEGRGAADAAVGAAAAPAGAKRKGPG